jgi:hypothetical protein
MFGWAGAFFRDLVGTSVFISYANDIPPEPSSIAGGEGPDGLPASNAGGTARLEPAPAAIRGQQGMTSARLPMAIEAERIAYAIGERGLKVFLDKQALRPGETFNSRIGHEIELSSMFIFLITERAVTPPNYALTELKFAMGKWRNPHGRILPVMMRETSLDIVPEYLKNVQILRPVGNVAAEVAAEAAKLASRIRSRRRPQILGAIGAVAIGLTVLIFAPHLFGEAGRVFRVYNGYVLNDPGEVIASDEVKGLENCQAMCERGKECKAFSYSPAGNCTLTESYSQFEPQRGGKVGVLVSEHQPKLK